MISGCALNGHLLLRDPRWRKTPTRQRPAYFAAFHAVSALFTSQGRDFSKHSALEAAVHRDLVKTGVWDKQLGADFSWLATVRSTGDYGGTAHVSVEDAREAVRRARKILDAVRITESFPE